MICDSADNNGTRSTPTDNEKQQLMTDTNMDTEIGVDMDTNIETTTTWIYDMWQQMLSLIGFILQVISQNESIISII